MAIDDFLTGQPDNPLEGMLSLNLPPAPQPPAPLAQTPVGGPPKGVQLALLALAGLLGPRRGGTGIAAGLHQSHQEQEAQRRYDQAVADRKQQDATRQYDAQRQSYDVEASQRQQMLQNTTKLLAEQLSKGDLADEAVYEQRIAIYTQLLNDRGLRVRPEYLKSRVPFVPPSSQKTAEAALEKAMKNPFFQRLAKEADPEVFANSQLTVRDLPQVKTMRDLLALAQQPMPDAASLQALAETPAAGAKPGTLEDYIARKAKESGRAPADLSSKEIAGMKKEFDALNDRPMIPLIIQTGQGPQIVNRGTGEATPITDQGGQPLVGAAPAPTEGQQTNALYATRMGQAEETIAQLQSSIAGMNFASFATQERLPAAFQSGEMQSYMQAARNFINAVLRRESGAVISPSEFSEAQQQYLPQPGDTPETLTQKAETRRIALQQLTQAAGRAYQPQTKPAPTGNTISIGGQGFSIQVIP